MADSSFQPNVFLLGARKAGSTTLYELVGTHPDICMSDPKEPRFFEAEYEKGLSYYRNTYFSHYSGEHYVCDASNRNLFVPFVPERIYETNLDAKFIVCLRNPVDRAYSHWWDHYSVGFEPLSFGEAIEENLSRLQRGERFTGADGKRRWAKNITRRYDKEIWIRYYVDAGYYGEQLKRYVSHFSRDQLKIVFLQELQTDTRQVIREIWRFIGVKNDEPERLSRLDDRPRHVRLGKAGAFLGTIARKVGISDVVPESVKELVRYNLNRFGDERPEMDVRIEQRLRAHYQPHIQTLQSVLPEHASTIQTWDHDELNT